MAQINVHLEEQTIIEFLVAEDEKVTCIQKYMLNVYMEVTLDVSSFWWYVGQSKEKGKGGAEHGKISLVVAISLK